MRLPNPFFDFKKFRIEQSGAAMKVGTDGVLIGAWAALRGTERRILDIGTGTGLVALMAAQRCPAARLDAVEIDADAAATARDNATRSPWGERVAVFHSAIQDFAPRPEALYDAVLSNPPFFVDSLKAPAAARSTARHNDTLSFDALAAAAARLLAPEGFLAVVYPTAEAVAFEAAAARVGLHPRRRLRVRGTPTGAFKRTLTEYVRHPTATVEEELTIQHAPGQYTDEYRRLTRDFYLYF